MEILRVMAIFIQHPWLAAVIGVFLAGLGYRRGRRTAIVAVSLLRRRHSPSLIP